MWERWDWVSKRVGLKASRVTKTSGLVSCRASPQFGLGMTWSGTPTVRPPLIRRSCGSGWKQGHWWEVVLELAKRAKRCAGRPGGVDAGVELPGATRRAGALGLCPLSPPWGALGQRCHRKRCHSPGHQLAASKATASVGTKQVRKACWCCTLSGAEQSLRTTPSPTSAPSLASDRRPDWTFRSPDMPTQPEGEHPHRTAQATTLKPHPPLALAVQLNRAFGRQALGHGVDLPAEVASQKVTRLEFRVTRREYLTDSKGRHDLAKRNLRPVGVTHHPESGAPVETTATGFGPAPVRRRAAE